MLVRKPTSTNLRNERWLLEKCPFSVTLAALGPRWGAPVLWKMFQGDITFAALMRALPLITEKMLAQELERLQALGLAERHVRSERPLRVDYTLTARGRSLEPLLAAMQAWGAVQLATAVEPEALPERQRLTDAAELG